MLTDTHCHLDFNKFDEDREDALERAIAAGVTHILIPALHLESSRAVVQLANSHPSLYAAVGFHPTDLDNWEKSSITDLRELIESAAAPAENGSAGKIVAVGEIGLDYYWVREPGKQAIQRTVLQEQLQLAQDVGMPVIIHMREEDDNWFGQASQDLLAILQDWHARLRAGRHALADRPGVLHSFNGNLDTARQALELNFLIGVTGPVTYKNAQEKRNIIKRIPLSSLLIETDAPFLTPVPHRGRRNEPAFVADIADKIAEIHMTTREQVAEITTANAARLFGWGG